MFPGKASTEGSIVPKLEVRVSYLDSKDRALQKGKHRKEKQSFEPNDLEWSERGNERGQHGVRQLRLGQ